MQFGMGYLVNGSCHSLYLAHALADSDFLVLEVVIAILARFHCLELNWDRGDRLQGFKHKVIIAHTALKLFGQSGQLLALGLGDIKDRYHPETLDRHFLFFHDRIAQVVQNRLLCLRIDLFFFHQAFFFHRRNNANGFLAFEHLALESFLPGKIPGNQ